MCWLLTYSTCTVITYRIFTSTSISRRRDALGLSHLMHQRQLFLLLWTHWRSFLNLAQLPHLQPQLLFTLFKGTVVYALLLNHAPAHPTLLCAPKYVDKPHGIDHIFPTNGSVWLLIMSCAFLPASGGSITSLTGHSSQPLCPSKSAPNFYITNYVQNRIDFHSVTKIFLFSQLIFVKNWRGTRTWKFENMKIVVNYDTIVAFEKFKNEYSEILGRIFNTRLITIRPPPAPIRYDPKLVPLNGDIAYPHHIKYGCALFFPGNSQRLVDLYEHSNRNVLWTFLITDKRKERTAVENPSESEPTNECDQTATDWSSPKIDSTKSGFLQGDRVQNVPKHRFGLLMQLVVSKNLKVTPSASFGALVVAKKGIFFV